MPLSMRGHLLVLYLVGTQTRPIVERDAQHASEEAGRSPLFWLHDTKVMGWDKKDEPEMVWY